jgi:hypothetical protein
MTGTPKDMSRSDKEKLDKKLDQALRDSFPDSDPPSTLVPDRSPPRKADVAGVPAEDRKKKKQAP